MELQQFDEQMILFAKIIFQQFDEIIASFKYVYEYSIIMEQLALQEYDGTIQSVLYNDEFWDVSTNNFIQRRFIYTWLIKYNEKNDNVIYNIAVKMIPDTYNDRILSVMNYSYRYFVSRWDEHYKHEIRTWAETEFGLCLK